MAETRVGELIEIKIGYDQSGNDILVPHRVLPEGSISSSAYANDATSASQRSELNPQVDSEPAN